MNSRNKAISLTFIFTCSLFSFFAQQRMTDHHPNTADLYIDAYVNLKFDDLKEYYTNESIFQDPTLALIDEKAAEKVIGPKAILEKLRRNFKGVTKPQYDMNNYYKVGDYHVYTGTYAYTQNATDFGGPDALIQFSLKSTTILKTNNGKIIEHIEYMDYSSWFEQFESQKNK